MKRYVRNSDNKYEGISDDLYEYLTLNDYSEDFIDGALAIEWADDIYYQDIVDILMDILDTSDISSVRYLSDEDRGAAAPKFVFTYKDGSETVSKLTKGGLIDVK